MLSLGLQPHAAATEQAVTTQENDMGLGFDMYLRRCVEDCVEGDANACSVGEIEAPKQSCNAPECCCDECWKKLNEVQP